MGKNHRWETDGCRGRGLSLEEIPGTGCVVAAAPTPATPIKPCPTVLWLMLGRLALSFPGLVPILLAFLKASFPSRGR